MKGESADDINADIKRTPEDTSSVSETRDTPDDEVAGGSVHRPRESVVADVDEFDFDNLFKELSTGVVSPVKTPISEIADARSTHSSLNVDDNSFKRKQPTDDSVKNPFGDGDSPPPPPGKKEAPPPN